MRANRILACLVCFLAAAALVAQASGDAAKAKSAPKAAGGKLVTMAAGDLKWADLDPQGAPGVKIVDLWGDHTKGGFGAFIKFPAGFMAPMHTHTHAYKIVVMQGTFVQQPDGKPEFRLGPGSYEDQPGDGYKHTTACDKASECMIFLESAGKFDLKPVAAPAKAAPAKK